MLVLYTVKLTIINNITSSPVIFNKDFQNEIIVAEDLLYDDYHMLNSSVYVLDLFQDEIQSYCSTEAISINDVTIDEYEIATITENVEVFFENAVDINAFTLTPDIKCYVYPKELPLPVPTLIGEAYDSTTIVWTWPNDSDHSHYLLSEPVNFTSEDDKVKIIATLPIGTDHYIETGLVPNTAYSRRLVNFSDTQTSLSSAEVTIVTETVNPKVSLDKYFIQREQDWSITNEEKEIITENLEAFKSGIGDFNDLKVYKQMDKDFYEKFKTNITVTGKYTKREKRYEQVGFNYKTCLEAIETIEEQEGEVKFKVEAYPWQECYKTEYVWAVQPITIKAKVFATIDLFKEVSETITKTVDAKYKIEEQIPASSKPTSVILVLDLSSSMRAGSPTRISKMKNVAIDFINNMKNSGILDIEYNIVGFATTANRERFSTTSGNTSLSNAESVAEAAKGCISSMFCGQTAGGEGGMTGDLTLGNMTDWGAGLDKAIATKENVGLFFFTDGFPTYPSDKTNTTEMCSYIKENAKAFKERYPKSFTHCFFGCKTSSGDEDTTWLKAGMNTAYKEKVRDALEEWLEVPYKSNNFNMDDTSQANLNQIFRDAFDLFTKAVTRVVTVTQPLTVSYTTIGKDYKTVKIESKEISFVIDGTKTPVTYDPGTKKAEILKQHWLPETQMSTETLYELLKQAKESCPEWLAGYNINNQVKDVNGNVIGDVYKNIHIKDTYVYSDEDDSGFNPNFNTEYGYGMFGTINVYSQIPTLNTSEYSDDEYVALSTSNSYLMINGYSDAIIYECIRYGHAIVNAYNRPSEVMFYRNDLYNLLESRMNKGSFYNGIIDSSNVFRQPLDLKLPEPSYLEITNDGINTDMVVSINKKYESPILNYRFNLLDPDAYTPYYEILPECNEDSSDKNLIVLTVYYAKNVEINSEELNDHYYSLFDYTTPAQSPLQFMYGLNATWNSALKVFEGDGQLISQYLHFYARKMFKTQPYYDELPGAGEDLMYGLVNGRYREENLSGKQDLFVNTPEFNIPTTVLASHADSVKIYIRITELWPTNALVSYKWDNEHPIGSGLTNVNGDYVTFSCDSLTYKDVDYYDILGTYKMKEVEMFDTKAKSILFEIPKPTASKDYDNLYVEVTTNNNDVLPTKYPSEIFFGSDSSTTIPIEFIGLVNATSKWSPRIHNGFYYINQHEKYLYSEFDVEANFDTTEDIQYESTEAFISFDVTMLKDGGETQNYSISKETIAEILQDEDNFIWVNKDTIHSGLTLKPTTEGWKYKHYTAKEWISPIMLFDNTLTAAGVLTLEYISLDDSNTGLELYVRSYDLDNGQWTEWVEFQNGTIPNTILSNGYQIKTVLSASETQSEYLRDDYLCCYLDWLEYIDMNVSENLVTITDHMTTGTYNSHGIAISNILNYSCSSGITLEHFSSSNTIQLLVSFSNNINDLVLENIIWQPATNATLESGYKYYRFKVIIPAGEKLYWIHLSVKTLQTDVVLPYIKSIRMSGSYSPADITGNFMVFENYTVLKDGLYHEVVPHIGDVISAKVLEKGFDLINISSINIVSTSPDMFLLIDNNILLPNPDITLLNTSIQVAANEATVDAITKLPYIFTVNNKITITGTPQQYSPVTVEDTDGNPFTQIYNVNPNNMKLAESFVIEKEINYIELKCNDYEVPSLQIWINDDLIPDTEYTIVNHLVMFKEYLKIDDTVTVSYNKVKSFYVEIDREKNKTVITVYTNILLNTLPDTYVMDDITYHKKFKVMFETNKNNNKLKAKELSLNPIYRTDYNGFIYLTEKQNENHSMKIWCNPQRVKAGGADSVDIQIEVLDIITNPIIGRIVSLDCNNGTIKCDSLETDMNGIVHAVYYSSFLNGTDTITAKILNDDDTISLQESIQIISY